MFTRFHNILTDKLHHLNPVWLDEVLYQETRKIIGAIDQILAYRDYIPVLIGIYFLNMKVFIFLNFFLEETYERVHKLLILMMVFLYIKFVEIIFVNIKDIH